MIYLIIYSMYAYHKPERSTMGSIFCVRQLIEKKKKLGNGLYDLEKYMIGSLGRYFRGLEEKELSNSVCDNNTGYV